MIQMCLVTFTLFFVFTIDGSSELSFLWHFHQLSKGYYKEINKDELLKVGFESILESLGDEYTEVINDEESKMLKGDSTTKRLNLQYNAKKGVYVNNLDESSTYYVAGLRTGDVILEINEISFENLTLDEVQEKAEVINSEVLKIKYKRGKDVLFVEVNGNARNNATKDNVTSSLISTSVGAVGYIDYDMFSIGSYKDFEKELEKLDDAGIQALILDLRDNPGGSNKDMRKIASLFVEGRQVIMKEKINDKMKDVYSSFGSGRKYPIFILANEESASCSEILIAALKEYNGATVIGSKTHGKGVSQTAYLYEGYSYKFTSSYWYTPSGESIHEKGIEPDIKVEGEDPKIIALTEIEKLFQ